MSVTDKIIELSNQLRQTDDDILTVACVERIYSEIAILQDEIESCQLFLEGQHLYTKWLEAAYKIISRSQSQQNIEQNHGNCENIESESRRFKSLIALALNNRGHLKYLQVDFEGAIGDYTLSLKYDPSLASAFYNRGLVTYRLAFFEQAVEDMERAVGLEPSREEFLEGLNRVKEKVGDPNGHDFKLEFKVSEEGLS